MMQKISREEKHELLNRSNIVEIVGRRSAIKKQGRDYIGLCPFHKEKTPSFWVVPSKNCWRCFGCSEHGNAIDFIMKFENKTFIEALNALRDEVGAVTAPAMKQYVAPQKSEEEDNKERARKIEKALGIWRTAHPAVGTIVETYLQNRGIKILPPASLRFVSNLRHPPTRLDIPAMVGGVQDGESGKIRGIHRTYLKEDGSDKIPSDNAKMMLGDCFGGHVRLCPAGEHLAIAEGIETALSIRQAIPEMPVWAAMSLGNMGAPVPPYVKHVILFGDADNKDQKAAERSMKAAAERLARSGREVRWTFPPLGMDFNDLLRMVNV